MSRQPRSASCGPATSRRRFGPPATRRVTVRHECARHTERTAVSRTAGLPRWLKRVLALPRDPRPRPDRGERRQRRRRHPDLCQRRSAVRLPDAVSDGAHHGGADRRAGDVLAAWRLHGRGAWRTDPRAVPAAQRRERDGAAVRRERGADGQRVRGRRRIHGNLRRLALHRCSARAHRDLGCDGAGQLLARGTRLPRDGPGVPRLPSRGISGPPAHTARS